MINRSEVDMVAPEERRGRGRFTSCSIYEDEDDGRRDISRGYLADVESTKRGYKRISAELGKKGAARKKFGDEVDLLFPEELCENVLMRV